MGKLCRKYNCKTEAKEGRTLCEKHLIQIKENSRRLREERKAKGLCPICTAKITDKRYVLCRGCRIQHQKRYRTDNAKAKILREERKAKGLCTYCGTNKINPDNPKTISRCDECYNKKRNYDLDERSRQRKQFREKRKADGLCPTCGKENNSGYVWCESCREHQRTVYKTDTTEIKQQRRERHAKGLCTQCGIDKVNPDNPNTKTKCDKCYKAKKEYDRLKGYRK